MLLIGISNRDLMVQELLKIHYPDHLNLIDGGQAWRLLMKLHDIINIKSPSLIPLVQWQSIAPLLKNSKTANTE